jgi:hypothetical protein
LLQCSYVSFGWSLGRQSTSLWIYRRSPSTPFRSDLLFAQLLRQGAEEEGDRCDSRADAAPGASPDKEL